MNTFGLGLVLNFVDNATSGMRSATQVFEQMSMAADTLSSSSAGGLIAAQQLGYGMTQLGNNFISAGSGILSIFSNISGKIVSTGSEFESFRITLSALYGDSVKAEEQLNKLIDFAAKTPFEVTDVKDLLVTLKSQGIDAFQQMTGATSGLKQETLSWIGDLMAFKPDVPMQRWKLALQNYIGSGESKMLRNVLDMGNIEDVLGHGIGETTQERMNDIVEIVEKANLGGLMNSMFGTWQQTLSNFQDQITKIFLAIADSGAYNTLKSALTSLTQVLSGMTDSELESFSKVLADSFNMIAIPVKVLAESLAGLLKSFIQLTMQHPGLAKIITAITGIVGAGLILSGVVLSLSGQFLVFASSIKYLGGLGTVFSVIGAGISRVLALTLPLIGISYLMYLAWSNNIGGIADIITSKLTFAFESASLIIDAFFDNTLSEERWLRARDMGILPFIEGLLNLKFEVQQTFSYLQDQIIGAMSNAAFSLPNIWNNIVNLTKSTFNNLGSFLTDIFSDLDWSVVIGALTTGLMLVFNPNMLKAIFLPLGTTILSGFTGAFKMLPAVISKIFPFIITPLTKLGTKILPILTKLFSPLTGIVTKVFSTVAPIVTKGFTLMLAALGKVPFVGTVAKVIGGLAKSIAMGVASTVGLMPALIGGAIIAGIAVLVALITNNSETIKSAFQAIWNKLPEPVQNAIIAIKNKISALLTYLIDKFGLRPVIDKVKQVLPQIIQWFSNVGNQVMQIIGQLINWVKSAWDSWLGDLVGNVVGFVGRLVQVVAGIAALVIPIVLDLISNIITVVTPIVDAIGQVVNGIMEILNGILDFIIGVFTGNWEQAWEGVKSIFSGIWEAIKGIAKAALNGVIGAVNFVISGLNHFKVPGTDKGVNIPLIPTLSTGGYVTKEGISYLHPNEVVVNSPMTKALGNFLNDYESSKYSKQPVSPLSNNYNQTPYNTEEYTEAYIDLPDTNVPIRNTGLPQTTTPSAVDNRVTFESGSIVIQVPSISTDELNKAADQLMRIIARKQQLQNMATRKA